MTEYVSFNLIDEKWIPCIRSEDGRSDLLSLRETLAESHLLEDITGDTPLQTAALYRLLIAILLRVYKPTANDFDTWQEMWTNPTWDMARINSYLDEWHHRFDLFDEERPFYQSDRSGKRDSVVTLKYGTGFRHNPLFDHDNDVIFLSLPPSVAARNLITIQAFGLGGAGGTRTDAPWSKGVIYFVHGVNLKETLFLNLLPYPDEDGGERLADEEYDLPTWEMEDPFEERKGQPHGYLDLLTWQNLKMMLFSEVQGDEIVIREVKFGGGLRLAKDFMDPMKFNLKSEQFTDGFRPISFEEDRGLWLNSYALFARMNMGGETTSWPPLTFNWLSTLVEHELIAPDIVYRCKAMGLGKNKGKVEYLREERFPFPLRYLVDTTLREQLRDTLREADHVARILHNSLCRIGMYLFQESADSYKWERQRINTQQDGVQRNEISKFVEEAVIGRWERGQLKAPGWIAHTDAEMCYWSSLDEPFQRLIAQLATEEPATIVRWWRAQVRAAANGAFTKAKEYAHESERAFHAIVEGQGYLAFQLNKMLGKEEKA